MALFRTYGAPEGQSCGKEKLSASWCVLASSQRDRYFSQECVETKSKVNTVLSFIRQTKNTTPKNLLHIYWMCI